MNLVRPRCVVGEYLVVVWQEVIKAYRFIGAESFKDVFLVS